MQRGPWRRVLLKLSGEALASSASDEVIDSDVVDRIATEVIAAKNELNLEVALVIGGGNIWRGATGALEGMDRSQSDYMGMLATVVNALAMQDSLERHGQSARVQSAIQMEQVCEPFIRRRAMRHLEKGRIILLAGGMGNPFFTTDTPAALRAADIGAEVVFKGTHGGVDGVYTADPQTNPDAVKLEEVTFDRVIAEELRVMDLTAITFCKDNKLPIMVFDVMTEGNIGRALRGEAIGTLVHNG